MRYIDIDGKTYEVSSCWNCPCYDNGDCGYMEKCKHPEGDGICAEYGGDWCDDPSERYGPNCPLKHTKKNNIVYAVMAKSFSWDGTDEVLDLYMDKSNAQKFIDRQLYPDWYYVKEWKVK